MKGLGILPNDKEWELELPNQTYNERVGIIGVNSWGQALQLNIDWRPQSSNSSIIKVDFNFEDGKGNTYYMNEQNLMAFDKSKREYKAPGISLEILCPFRRLRIKFRGYLNKKGTNDLIFVKIRLLWTSMSNIFDFESDHKKQFIEQELKNNCVNKTFESIKFENRFEQMGQMKGQFQINHQNEEKLFLWGNKSKKYEEKSQTNINRLFGYSKKGWVFHVGSVEDQSNRLRYRYGFAFWGKSLIYPIESLSDMDLTKESLTKGLNFSLKASDKSFEVSVNKGSVDGNVFQIKVNGSEGNAVYMSETEDQDLNDYQYSNQLYFPFAERTDDLVLTLNDRKAENVLISGGKGSSLASLNYLRKNIIKSVDIEIPKGIVVTCNAYQLIVDQNKQISRSIDKLKSLVSKPEALKTECVNVSNVIKSVHLPQEIKDEIRLKLEFLYNKNELNNKSFAVRSSASGEDSEDMSAAGQMTTYLGVRGLDAIYSSVVKCLSSQFEFIAVEYKRGYGQDINSPMAVVIQEMVDCDSAGVLFTCDPVSGDERQIIITGNYGIGESVVSAMAEPDTIRVAINVTDNSYINRSVEGIKSISIGSKAKSIKMDGSGSGTVEVDTTDTSSCCLSDEKAIKLAEIALEIQKFFGSVRDIEWGIKGDQIYILQSRPVTNLDSGFTDFEITHELDIGLPSETEYLTKANVGEVVPGCSSSLALTFLMRLWMPEILKDLHKTEGLPIEVYTPYAAADIASYCKHLFLNLKNSEFLKISNENDSNYCKALILSIFGHELDPQIIEDCKEVTQSESFKVKFWRQLYLFPFMILPQYFVNRYDKLIHKQRYVLDDKFDSIKDMFEAITQKANNVLEDGLTHIKVTFASSMYNYYLISLLSEDKNNPNIFSDFAFLMSQCGQLVSVDVPSALRQLAQSIEEPEIFRQLSDEKALEYLRNNNQICGKKFREFLSKHGHRGYKEFDPLTRIWRENPIPVIQSLKTMLSTDASSYKTTAKVSAEDIIESLKTPLSFHRKMILKYVILPLARRAVGMRESTKSLMVFGFDLGRQALWALADRMHFEGLIPDSELLFHMTLDEIESFIETRNPIIIAKSKQRRRLHYKMNDWKFDEIVSGYDFQPRHLLENTEIKITGDEVIKGTPVSVGRIVARVCVAPNLEDAVNIRSGDILVTYSTDIGWSPYFPMIGGIATEIGGLVSHGAVIAREYGLPCLVGANGACRLLKTGDLVLLDCQKGIITRVVDNNQNQINK